MAIDYNDYVNVAAYQAQTQRAQAEAQAAYQQALAQGATDQQALDWAKFRWQQKLDEATQTGMWNGQWNNPQEQWFTGQFGQWFGPGGEPGVGAQTLTAEQQRFNQANQLSQQYGQYYAPGTTPLQGMQTQQGLNQAQAQALNEAAATGYYNAPINTNVDPMLFGKQDRATQDWYLQYNQNDPQAAANAWARDNSYALKQYAMSNPDANRQMTMQMQQQQFAQGLQTLQEQRAAQGQAQNQTMAYLNLLSQLRGPADWAKYQQVLGSTPGGMRDLYAAAMGQYVPGGGATTGVNPQAASLQSMYGDVSGTPYTGQGGGQLGQPNVYTGQQQGGGQVWGSGLGIGQTQPTPQQQQQGTGNGTNLPAPNQISAQSWNNMAPSQKQMLLGIYESQGWDANDVKALMNQSLPKYATNTGAGTWRLQ